MKAEQRKCDIIDMNPRRHSDCACDCKLCISGDSDTIEVLKLLVNLINLPFHKFDLISAMDWLAIQHTVLIHRYSLDYEIKIFLRSCWV